MNIPDLGSTSEIEGLRYFLAYYAGFKFSDRDGQPLVVYTDSCSFNNGSRTPRAASVWCGFEGVAEDCELCAVLHGREHTNNRVELWAVVRALQEYPYPLMHLEIRTDSKYVIGCATEWIHMWGANGFTNCKGLTFVHVPAHADDEGNARLAPVPGATL